MSKSEALMAIQLMELEIQTLVNTEGFCNCPLRGARCDWLLQLIADMQWEHCIATDW